VKAGRKVATGVGVTLALLLLALALVPVLFRDRIEARAKEEIGRALNARVDWRHVSLSFFRHFPALTLSLDDLTVLGVGTFDGDTLAAVRSFRLVLDVGSVLFGDQTVIRSIDVDAPILRLVVLEDGTANWDIVRKADVGATTPEPGGAGLDVGLRALNIRGGTIAFDNRQAGLAAVLEDVELEDGVIEFDIAFGPERGFAGVARPAERVTEARVVAARRNQCSLANSTWPNWCRIMSCSTAGSGTASTSASTYQRYPSSVGTRPADVCGCDRSPDVSSSARMWRTVAEDTPRR